MNNIKLESLLSLIRNAYCININGKRFESTNYNDGCLHDNAMIDDIIERYGKDSVVKSFKQTETIFAHYDIEIEPVNNYDGANLKKKIVLIAQWEYYTEIYTTADDDTDYEHELREKIKRGEITRNDADFTEVYESDRVTW